MASFLFCRKEKEMSHIKARLEEIREIMEVFSGDELRDKLRASFGYSDAEISEIISYYGRNDL
jgi:hypothetical protein